MPEGFPDQALVFWACPSQINSCGGADPLKEVRLAGLDPNLGNELAEEGLLELPLFGSGRLVMGRCGGMLAGSTAGFIVGYCGF